MALVDGIWTDFPTDFKAAEGEETEVLGTTGGMLSFKFELERTLINGRLCKLQMYNRSRLVATSATTLTIPKESIISLKINSKLKDLPIGMILKGGEIEIDFQVLLDIYELYKNSNDNTEKIRAQTAYIFHYYIINNYINLDVGLDFSTNSPSPTSPFPKNMKKLLLFNTWILTYTDTNTVLGCYVQKVKLENEIKFDKNSNIQTIILSDSAQYANECLNEKNLNILDDNVIANNAFREMGPRDDYSHSYQRDFVTEFFEFANFKGSGNTKKKIVWNSNFYYPVDDLYLNIFEDVYHFWFYYLMHNLTISIEKEFSNFYHPYYYTQFWKQGTVSDYPLVPTSTGSELVWKKTILGTTEIYSRNVNTVYFLMNSYTFQEEQLEYDGGFFGNLEDSFSKTWSNFWDFIVDSSECCGIIGDFKYYMEGDSITYRFYNQNISNSARDEDSYEIDLERCSSPAMETNYTLIKSCKISQKGMSTSCSEDVINFEESSDGTINTDEWNIKNTVFFTNVTAKVTDNYYKSPTRWFDDTLYCRKLYYKEAVKLGTPYIMSKVHQDACPQFVYKNKNTSQIVEYLKNIKAIGISDQEVLEQYHYSTPVKPIYKFTFKYSISKDGTPGIGDEYTHTTKALDILTFKVIDYKLVYDKGKDLRSGEITMELQNPGDYRSLPWRAVSFSDTDSVAFKFGKKILQAVGTVTGEPIYFYDSFTWIYFTDFDDTNDSIKKVSERLKLYQQVSGLNKSTARMIQKSFGKIGQYYFSGDFFTNEVTFDSPTMIEYVSPERVGTWIEVDTNGLGFPAMIKNNITTNSSVDTILMESELDLDSCMNKIKLFGIGLGN